MKDTTQIYLFQANIIECQNLIGNQQRDLFVKISIAKENPQTTTIIRGVSSIEWNQQFTFTNIELSQQEFQTFLITFEIFELSNFMYNKLLGQFSISISSLYSKLNHEIFNTWLQLNKDQNKAGYLKVSCYIIQPNDRPPFHPEEDYQKDYNLLDNNSINNIVQNPKINQKGYQVYINIAKAEHFPVLKFSCNSYISVRIGDEVQRTQIIEDNTKPKFSSKFFYPIFFPLFQDTIIIKAWDQGTPVDRLIGNIPEKINQSSIFKIQNLQIRQGYLPYTWINIYGIPYDERQSIVGKLIQNKKKYIEGTQYMGRVLLSLSLMPCINPVKQVSFLGGFIEPQLKKFFLYVDIYKGEFKIKNKQIYIGIKFGGHKEIFSKKINEEYNEQSQQENNKIFIWHENDNFLDAIISQFPNDINQIPDIVVSIYKQGTFKTNRIGYKRIKPILNTQINQQPKWITIKSIDNPQQNIGSLLSCFSLFNKNIKNQNRVGIQKDKQQKFVLLGRFYQCLELFPDQFLEVYNLIIKVTIENFCQEYKYESESCFIQLNEDIFEILDFKYSIEYSNYMQIEFYLENKKENFLKKFYKKDNLQYIGKVQILPLDIQQIKQIKDFKVQPMIYEIKNNDKIQGKFLADLYLMKLIHSGEADIDVFQKHIVDQKRSYKFQFSLIGLRNLIQPIENLIIKIRIKNKAKKFKSQLIGITNSLNYLQVCEFQIELSNHQILWPFVEIYIYDQQQEIRNYHYVKYLPLSLFSLHQIPNQQTQTLSNSCKEYKKIKQNLQNIFKSYDIKCNSQRDEPTLISMLSLQQISTQKVIEKKIKSDDPLYENKFSNKIKSNNIYQYRIQCTREQKQKEFKIKQKQIQHLHRLNQIQNNAASNYVNQDTQEQIRKIKNSFQTKEKFLNNLNINKDSKRYGRQVLKGKLQIKNNLKYIKIYLNCLCNFSKCVKTVHNQDIQNQGHQSKCIMKCLGRLFTSDTQIKTKNFDVFDKIQLKIFKFITQIKTRVYILRCFNLNAQQNVNNIKNILAGYKALSSSNPYPELQIGNNECQNKNFVKFVSDRNNNEVNTLDPIFYRAYELDLMLPEDNELLITIKDKKQFYGDGIIGYTKIDLEDRFFMDEKRCKFLTLLYKKKQLKKQIINLQDINEQQSLQIEIESISQDIKTLQQSITINNPIEFMKLTQGQNFLNSGSIQLIIDTFTLYEIQKYQMLNLEKPKKEKYEMRLIIWNVKDIKFDSKNFSDIFIRATLDTEGWSGVFQQKSTDVHLMSNGEGQYNYRIKFSLKIPCPFPRLKIQVFDFETFSNDNAIVQNIHDFSYVFKDIKKEGVYKSDELILPLYNNNEFQTQNGKIKISFDLLQQSEADSNPVGEGQNEPNRDPILQKPDEGRKVKDYIQGRAINLWKYFTIANLIKNIKYIIFGSLGFIVFIILFIFPGIIVN